MTTSGQSEGSQDSLWGCDLVGASPGLPEPSPSSLCSSQVPPTPAPGSGGQGWVNNKVILALSLPLSRSYIKSSFFCCLLIALIKLFLKSLCGVHQWGPSSLQALA